MKKFLACALGAIMLITSLAACGEAPTADPSPSPSASPASSADVEYDWASAYAKYPADTVVLSVNGEDVTWDEYFYWLYSEYVQNVSGMAMDVMLNGVMTVSEYLRQDVENFCVQYRVLNQQAAANSIELTEDDQKVFDEQLHSDIDSLVGEDGTEEELYDYLATIYVTPEIYEYINRMMVLYPRVFIEMYGQNGEKLTDEEVMAFADEYGFMTAKHILFRNTDDEGNELSEEEMSSKLEQANELVSELRAVPEAEREALFDQMMNEYSEDPGLANYPDGYCFEPGVVVQEFSDGVAALEEGGISDVVESSSGYHILMREPVTPDDLVLLGTAQPYTLRYAAAVMDYNTTFTGWTDSAEVVYADEFADFEPAQLFE